MTEERLEQLVEGAASRFDRSMNRAWEHRPVRLMGGALSLLTGAGLIAKAVPLAQEGRAATARVCLAAGSLVLLAVAARSVGLRRNFASILSGISPSLRYLAGWRFSVTGGATLSPPPGGPAGRCTGGSGGC